MPQISFAADRRRLLIEATVFGPNPTDFDGMPARALIDTGATVSGIGPRVVATLGLRSYGKRPLGSATEERMVAYYLFRIGLPSAGEGATPAWPHVFDRIDGFSWSRAMNFDLIIGMDGLLQCGLVLSPGGRCVLRYGERG